MADELESTYMCAAVITKDHTTIESALSADSVASVCIREYPVNMTIHVTRQSLRNLIDACLDLQAKLAEKERAA